MNLKFQASSLWLMLSKPDTCHSNVDGLDTTTWRIPQQKWTLFKCQYWLVNGIFIIFIVLGWFVKVQHRNRKSILMQQFKFAIILIYSYPKYHQTSNISGNLRGNEIVDHSDVFGASPVGAAPTTSSLSTKHLDSMAWAKTTARRGEKHLSFGI